MKKWHKKIIELLLGHLKIIVLLLTVVIAITYFCCCGLKSVIDDFASILAIPSFLVSILVWEKVTVSEKDLIAYHNQKRAEEEVVKLHKTNARKQFDDHLGQMTSIVRIYVNNLKNTKQGLEISTSNIKDCMKNIDVLTEFINRTSPFIFNVYLPTLRMEKKSEVAKASTVNLESCIKESDKESLDNLLGQLSADLFNNTEKEQIKIGVLEKLFSNHGLIDKYIATCEASKTILSEGK